MTTSPTPTSANTLSLTSPLASPHVSASLPQPRRGLHAPNWLQVVIIVALLASAVYVAIYGRYLWCALLAIAGLAFGASFLLRHMVGDDYGRA